MNKLGLVLLVSSCIVLLIVTFNILGKLEDLELEHEFTKIDLNYYKSLDEINKNEIQILRVFNQELLDKQKGYLEKLIEMEYELKKIRQNVDKPSRGGGFSSKRLLGNFEATAYCPCIKCCGINAKGITASGTKVMEGRTIAVDPNIIPLGSKVYIEGYGIYISEDTGSAIKGNIFDMYFESHSDALKFGRKKGIKVWIID